MTELTLAHTSLLEPATLQAVRAMIVEAFDGGFGDHDWDHSLGGIHCIAWHDGEPIGHAAVASRVWRWRPNTGAADTATR